MAHRAMATSRRLGRLAVVIVFSVWVCASACTLSDHGDAGLAVPTAGPTAGLDAFERSVRGIGLRLTLPPSHTAEPYPLIVALHSLFHDGSEPKKEWGFDALAAAYGFAVAYPDGTGMSWNAGTCCEAAAASGVDDVEWLRSLVAHLEENYPVDHRRVHLVGFSNGGMLAYRYACEHGDELAGVGIVAGSVQVATCVPPAPVNVVAVHGLADRHIPYDGLAWSDPLRSPISSAADSLAPFRAAAGCYGSDKLEKIIFTDPDGGISGDVAGTNGAAGKAHRAAPVPSGTPSGTAEPSTAMRRQSTCSSRTTIVEYLLPRFGHGWPTPTGPGAFDTADVIWRTLEPGRSRVPGPRM